MQDGVDIMPIFCKDCIHNQVCRHICIVKDWENKYGRIGTSTENILPIHITCEMKRYDSKTAN